MYLIYITVDGTPNPHTPLWRLEQGRASKCREAQDKLTSFYGHNEIGTCVDQTWKVHMGWDLHSCP